MTREHPRDVGQAMRATIARAATANMSSRDWRVLCGVLSMTVSWNKTSDRVSIAQVAAAALGKPVDEIAGWERDRCGQALRRLSDAGVIGYAPGRGPGAAASVWLLASEMTSRPGMSSSTETQAEPACVSDPMTSQSGMSLPSERHAGSARKTSQSGAKDKQTGGHTGYRSGYFSGFEPSPNARGRTRGQTPKPESPPDPLYNRIRSIWPDTWPATIHTTLDELRHGHNIADHLIDAAIGQAEQRHMNDPVNNPCRYIARVATDWYQQRVSA